MALEMRNQRTASIPRQGAWFFLPRPWMEVLENGVLLDQPIQRGGGKPHRCEMLCRTAGVRVYVSKSAPNGLTEQEFRSMPAAKRQRERWEPRFRDAEVYVKGRVEHADHETIVLPYWHKVVMNTETRSQAMSHLAFLD